MRRWLLGLIAPDAYVDLQRENAQLRYRASQADEQLMRQADTESATLLRLLEANKTLRAEVAQLTAENAELRTTRALQADLLIKNAQGASC